VAALGQRFSREDLMRAFDLLAKAETDIRTASHPRYHFEMALLRWMHVRRLVPLADLMEQLGGGGARPGTGTAARNPGAETAARIQGSPASNSAAAAASNNPPAANE